MPTRRTKVVLGVSVTAALVASGVAVTTASADETPVPANAVEAESFAAQSGVRTENTADSGGGKNSAYLASGDWMRFDGVEVGAAVSARIASDNAAGGSIELRAGTPTGTVLATIPVAKTGGWQKWVTKTASATGTGKQNVVAVLKSNHAADFVNINWFTFSSGATPAPTTPAPTTPAPTTPAPTKPTGDGWVKIDETKWAVQLAEYNAIQAKPVPANNVRVPEFNAACKPSHRLSDDPIVFPGMAGASHLHTFMGNTSANAESTNESLFAVTESTCDPEGEDRSSYWIPSLLENGEVVDPHGMTVYYGSRLKDPTKTVPFPEGFRMIAGDAKRQVASPKGAPGQFWCAGAGGETGRSADGNWPVCADKAEITFHLTFPDCWDGVHLDSPDHVSHIGGPGPDGTCASGKFPVAIPSLAFVIGYPTNGSSAGFKLASGLPSSMHGDFMNAWQTKPLAERVRNCITQSAKCDSYGRF